MRLRIWYAKCGVADATSWRTSSTVTSRSPRRRSGCSASAIRYSLGSGVDGLNLQERIYPGLDGRGDRALVADDPAVVVDAADRVLVVAGLDVEQVVLQRRGQDAGV